MSKLLLPIAEGSVNTEVKRPCTKNCSDINVLRNKSNVLKMFNTNRPKNCAHKLVKYNK